MLAFMNGSARRAFFSIDLSENGSDYETVFEGASSGNIDGFENYSFSQKNARYVRINVKGNSINLWNSLCEVSIPKLKEPFSDVTEHWAKDDIMLLNSIGLVNGVSDTMFNPTGYITRQDACTIIYRYLTQNLLLNSTIRSSFADSSSFASYAAEAIEVLAGNKIVNGFGDGTFGAESYITRAECAVLVSNCILHINGN